MKTISATAIVALMTATFGLSAIAPATAQDAAPTAAPQQENFRGSADHRGPRQAGMGDFLSFERGAEAIEIALVRLSHAIELTTEQQPLFDAFKAAALAAAEDLSTTLEGLRPAAPAAGTTATATAPDFSERLDTRIAVETARLAALEAVQPSATAFFDSLTDEQKTALMPQRPDRNGGPGMGKGSPRDGGQHWNGQQHGQNRGHGPVGAPGMAPMPPVAAPTDAPAPAAPLETPADAPAPVNG